MELIYLLAFVILILTSIYYYLTWNYNFWQKQGIPCAKGIIPGLGNLAPAIFRRQHFNKICENYYKNNENYSMFGFYYLTTPALLVRDPELVKNVLQTQFANFKNNLFRLHCPEDTLLTLNPFFTPHESWKDNRAPLSNAFSSKKLKIMFPLIMNVTLGMNDYLKRKIKLNNGKFELELKQFCNMYTGEVGATQMGIQGHNFQDEDDSLKNRITIKKIVETLFESSAFSDGFSQFFIWYWPKLAKLFNMYMIPRDVDLFFRHTVRNILAHRKGDNKSNDYLQIITDYLKANGTKHNEEMAIASYMLSFAVEIYETSAITLSYLEFQLAAHPEIQEKVRKEIKSVYAKCNGKLDYEMVKEMPYLDQVLDESMRLNHVLGTFVKVCTNETELVGSDGLTCKVKPGNKLVLSTYGLQMDPKYWPNPEKFDPDRFSEEQKAGRHKFTFIPFGEGPRICVGMRISIIMIKLAIASILNDYSLEVSPKTPLPLRKDETSFLNANDGGLWVIVKPLKPNSS